MNRRTNRFHLICLVAVPLLLSCGSDSGSSLTQFGQSYVAMTDAMEGTSLVNDLSAAAVVKSSATRAAISTPWASAYMNDPRCSGGATDPHCLSGNITLKEYMGVVIDKDSVRDNGSSISVFGRIKNAVMIGCAVMNTVADGSGAYPTDGTHTLTLTAAIKATIIANCDLASTDLDDAPTTAITITVSTPADGIYAKKFAFSFAASRDTEEYFLTYTAGTSVKIGKLETNSNGASRTLINYNFVTRVGTAEYVSADPGCTSNCNGEVIRLFWDGANDQAAMTHITGGTGSSKMYYYLAGKPGVDTALVGLSVHQTGYSTNASGSACVDPSNGNVSTDDVSPSTTACSAGIVSVTSGTTAMDNFFTNTSYDYQDTYWSTAMTTSTTTAFTSMTDIVTATFQ